MKTQIHPPPRRLLVTALTVIAVGLGGGAIFLKAADPLSAVPPRAGRGHCVGISSQRLSPNVIRVYRVFEDGSVEASDDGAGSHGDWVKVGK